MAKLPELFDANTVEDTGFEPLPAGWYLAEIVGSEIKSTKAGTGKILVLQYKILDSLDHGDKYNNRRVFDNLNIINPNQTAMAIAQRRLAEVCKACHIDVVEDSSELHNIPVGILLDVEEGSNGYPPRNVIKRVVSEEKYNEIVKDVTPF